MKKILLFTIVFTSITIVWFSFSKIGQEEKISATIELKPTISITPDKYKVKEFNLSSISFLSTKQIEEHYTLYKGYVHKLNEIRDKINKAPRLAGVTYSEFRSLKIAETFALNGILLHELYLENITDIPNTEPSELFIAEIDKSFGSFAEFLKDLGDCAASSRGWAVTCYCLFDKTISNFVLDAHNETVPILAIPLAVLDVYEHAYMIDFGIDRASYISQLKQAINWDVVEKRLIKAKNIQN